MKRTFSKKEWKNVRGASSKPKRLKLQPDDNNMYVCPLDGCDSNAYQSQRGCRKHVTEKHGWYFYFDQKPKLEDAFPEKLLQPRSKLSPSRSKSWDMPSFSEKCRIAQEFINWICSAGGGRKDKNQAQQICKKILKFAKYCCTDMDESFELTKILLQYCVGSVKFIERFVTYLETDCKMGKPGIIAYLQSLAHCLDFLRFEGIEPEKIATFMTSEIFLSRAKQCLRKQMRVEWNTLLSVETLESKKCWASLADLQRVLPFHENRYKQVVNLVKCNSHSSHDLSFSTAFIVTLLFLKVKGSRPMSYRFITVPMINTLKEGGGIIDQTDFKTNETYSFDSLVFKKETLELIKTYIDFVRPKLKPKCQYLLVCRNGNQIVNLGDMFGRMVYQAIGKYINPTRYRQIIETESAERLTVEEQALVSLDQKHTSNVAKVHYQKKKSQDVARKASTCIESLVSSSSTSTETSECSSLNSDSESPNSDPLLSTANDIQKESTSSEDEEKSVKVRKRKTKILFTAEEDNALIQGLKKHGKGKWTRILKDPDFLFHPSRTNATLMLRAKSKKYI